MVHEALHRLHRVPKAKGHPRELEEAERRRNGRLLYVLLCYRNLVEGTYEVDFLKHIPPG